MAEGQQPQRSFSDTYVHPGRRVHRADMLVNSVNPVGGPGGWLFVVATQPGVDGLPLCLCVRNIEGLILMPGHVYTFEGGVTKEFVPAEFRGIIATLVAYVYQIPARNVRHNAAHPLDCNIILDKIFPNVATDVPARIGPLPQKTILNAMVVVTSIRMIQDGQGVSMEVITSTAENFQVIIFRQQFPLARSFHELVCKWDPKAFFMMNVKRNTYDGREQLIAEPQTIVCQMSRQQYQQYFIPRARDAVSVAFGMPAEGALTDVARATLQLQSPGTGLQRLPPVVCRTQLHVNLGASPCWPAGLVCIAGTGEPLSREACQHCHRSYAYDRDMKVCGSCGHQGGAHRWVLSLLATLRQDNTVVNNLLIEDDLVGTAFPALQALAALPSDDLDGLRCQQQHVGVLRQAYDRPAMGRAVFHSSNKVITRFEPAQPAAAQ